jgi:hypothetical protein
MIDLCQYKPIVVCGYKQIMSSHDKSIVPCDCKRILLA